ncbi:Uncharacterised protein [Salmonella enterica subsp. enterica serovar Bovismorbificans]|uniref:Uncharacterized protein n=1 Tax=Salmonella enterica subsp. enterica serovar Bovismorbificans TaxID=58097 RepID=A0A655BZ24_SALET|nr:Uncharacterised protein [Salmonella enterica subsp. enterica serovar Bovismorbificans]
MFKLVNDLPRLIHSHTAQPPVRMPLRSLKAGNHRLPVYIEFQTLRAVNNILQHQIVNGGIGMFVFSTNVKQIAAGNSVWALIKNV